MYIYIYIYTYIFPNRAQRERGFREAPTETADLDDPNTVNYYNFNSHIYIYIYIYNDVLAIVNPPFALRSRKHARIQSPRVWNKIFNMCC